MYLEIYEIIYSFLIHKSISRLLMVLHYTDIAICNVGLCIQYIKAAVCPVRDFYIRLIEKECFVCK